VFNQPFHRKSAPLRDAGPTLDAMMQGDELFSAQRAKIDQRELDRILD
jgi:hypothetical protein